METFTICSIVLIVAITLAILLYQEAQRRRQYEVSIEAGLHEIRAIVAGGLERVSKQTEVKIAETDERHLAVLTRLRTEFDQDLEAKVSSKSAHATKYIGEIDDTVSQKVEIVVRSVAKLNKDMSEAIQQQNAKLDNLNQSDESVAAQLKYLENEFQSKLNNLSTLVQQLIDQIQKEVAAERATFLEALCLSLLSDPNLDDGSKESMLYELLRSQTTDAILMLTAEKYTQIDVAQVLSLMARANSPADEVNDVFSLAMAWIDRLIQSKQAVMACEIGLRLVESSHKLKPFGNFVHSLPKQLQLYEKVAGLCKGDDSFANRLAEQLKKTILSCGPKRDDDDTKKLLDVFDLIYESAPERSGQYREQIRAAFEPNQLVDPLISEVNELVEGGFYDKAKLLLEEALRKAEKDDDDARLSSLSEGLANIEIRQVQYANAEALYRHLADRQERKNSEAVSGTYFNLGNVLSLQKKYDEAEVIFKKSMDTIELHHGHDHENLLPVLMQLAGLCMSNRRYKEAEPFYKRILEIKHKTHGEHSDENVVALTNLGELYIIQENFVEAEIFLESALEAAHAAYAPDDARLARVARSYADLLSTLGRRAQQV